MKRKTARFGQQVLLGGAAALALMLAACSPSGSEEADTSDETAVVETGTGAEGTTTEGSAEYRSRDELMAEFDAALEQAMREKRSPPAARKVGCRHPGRTWS